MAGDVIDLKLERDRKAAEEKIKRLFDEAKAEYERSYDGKRQQRRIARLSLLLEYTTLMNTGGLDDEQYNRFKRLQERGFFDEE